MFRRKKQEVIYVQMVRPPKPFDWRLPVAVIVFLLLVLVALINQH
jgi:predicted membrane-bound dolichyl-phosphate-mannose-protein mannosyltransferase